MELQEQGTLPGAAARTNDCSRTHQPCQRPLEQLLRDDGSELLCKLQVSQVITQVSGVRCNTFHSETDLVCQQQQGKCLVTFVQRSAF